MVRVEKCCCCELKTGTIVVATLGWILTLIKLFGLIAAAADGGQNERRRQAVEINKAFGTDIPEEDNLSAATLAYRIGYGVVSLVCCILLVVGVYKKSAGYFIPYMIVSCLEAIVCTIVTGVCFVYIFIAQHPLNIVLGVLFAVLVGFSALTWYLWIVVYSYYHVVKNETNPNMPPSGGNVYYSPTSTQPPPYEKDRAQLA